MKTATTPAPAKRKPDPSLRTIARVLRALEGISAFDLRYLRDRLDLMIDAAEQSQTNG